jgi:hypothetical protein
MFCGLPLRSVSLADQLLKLGVLDVLNVPPQVLLLPIVPNVLLGMFFITRNVSVVRLPLVDMQRLRHVPLQMQAMLL